VSPVRLRPASGPARRADVDADCWTTDRQECKRCGRAKV
jgi:hypothetical protein